MRRCQLCSRSVEGADVVCPTCGGALVDAEPAPTWAVPPGSDPTQQVPIVPGPPRLAKAPSPGSTPPGPAFGAPPAFGPPQGYGYVGYGPTPSAALPTDPMAVASLVTAILGLVGNFVVPALPLLACPVAAILGHAALRRIDRERRTSGRGLALAGVIVGWIGTAIGVLGLAALVLLIWGLSQGSGS